MLSRFASCLFVSLCLLATPASAELDAGEKAEVRTIIEQYLMENPELVRDVLTNLAQREQRAELDRALAVARQDEEDGLMGNPNGDVTIYEFSDYNCGYCKRVFNDLRQVLSEDPNVELRVKEFPILSDSSVVAARAGLAAQRQGKFEAFHVIMMQSVGGITEQSIQDAALLAGLDMKQFAKDRQDGAIDARLSVNSTLARQLKLTGTPALIIGDVVVPGAISAAQIKELVAVARSKNNS